MEILYNKQTIQNITLESQLIALEYLVMFVFKALTCRGLRPFLFYISKYMSDKKLGKLFGSKVRAKIISIFLRYPEEQFYSRQLERMVKVQLNAIRRELQNLKKLGIIEKGEKSKQFSFFKIKRDFALFNEFKKIFVS